jgi:hypothetical protein
MNVLNLHRRAGDEWEAMTQLPCLALFLFGSHQPKPCTVTIVVAQMSRPLSTNIAGKIMSC